MRIEYSKRATADLRRIAEYYRQNSDDPRVAGAIGERIRDVVARIGKYPGSAPRVLEREGVRVALVLRYPYKIFYRVIGDTVRIVHIRHTARRPWTVGNK
jgi:plasmid stabilization system protein ParE